MMQRLSRIAILCMVSLLFVACGDDDDSKENNENNVNNINNQNNLNNQNNQNNLNNENNQNNLNNENNQNNLNNMEDLQCSQPLADCTPGEPTDPRFVCADEGLGPKCFSACTPPQAAGQPDPCTSGQVCIGAGFCLPSQCGGYADSEGCDELAAAEPGDFPNGASCAAARNSAFVCAPAGTVAVGDACEVTEQNRFPCESGSVCTRGQCRPFCEGDGDCTAEGESCVGDASGRFFGAGVGVCGTSCESYELGQCGEGLGCSVITEDEGLCTPVGDKLRGEDCIPGLAGEDQCGDGLTCLVWQRTSAANAPFQGLARCMPTCNGGADSQAAADATCPTEESFCFDFASVDPDAESGPTSGLCFETCTADEYGDNKCAGDSNACSPFRGTHSCLPGGEKEVGEACDPDVLGDCREGATCEARGEGGTPECVAFCDRRDTPNEILACSGEQSCRQIGEDSFEFGICGLECTPTNFVDNNCPEGLKSCFPGEDGTAFCSPSGATAEGEACGNPFEAAPDACGAGLSCVNQFLRGGVFPGGSGTPTGAGICEQVCEFGGDSSECGAGETCAPNVLGDATRGACLDFGSNDTDLGVTDPCTEEGKACNDNAVCIVPGAGQSPVCIHYCDAAENDPDTGDNPACDGTCTTIYPEDLTIGTCAP